MGGTASAYTAAVTITTATTLNARVLDGGEWSPIESADLFATNPPPLRVTELMYHPSDPSAAEITAGIMDVDLFEFIELRNIGADTLDLASISFTAGIVFESSTLLLETSLRANAHSLSVIPQPSLFATDRAFLSLARIQAASRIAQKPLPLPTQEL